MRLGRLVLPLAVVVRRCYMCGKKCLFADEVTGLPFCSGEHHERAAELTDPGPPRYATFRYCPIKAHNKGVIDKKAGVLRRKCAWYDDCPMNPKNGPRVHLIHRFLPEDPSVDEYWSWGEAAHKDRDSGDIDRVLAEEDYLVDNSYDIEQDVVEGVLEDEEEVIEEELDDHLDGFEYAEDYLPPMVGILGILDNPHFTQIVTREESDFFVMNDTVRVHRETPGVIVRKHFRRETRALFLKGLRLEKQCACYSAEQPFEKDEPTDLL